MTEKAVFSFHRYLLAQAERRKAYEQYCYAGANLKLAQIYERLAEIESQTDPIASRFPNLKEGERERLIDLVTYVVAGRFTAEPL